MSKTIDSLVRDFHEAMDIPVVETPSVPSDERVRLRASLIAEEFFETMAAMFGEHCPNLAEAQGEVTYAIENNRVRVDLVELADGLCDLDYVVAGTRLEFGIPGEEVLAEVHAANMRKTGGPLRADGKRLKPPGWVGPDVAGVIERAKR
jgi:predicted HAD superfamily Cof-like phosphohydrolase